MLAYSVFVASLIAIWVIQTRGLQHAFLYVWLPFYLFMPFSFWVNIPGLPDPNFMQAAILPILFYLVREQLKNGGFGFGRMEFLFLLYFVIRIFNDFLSRGYSDAQNFAFYMLSALLGPYLLARYLITNRAMDIKTGKMMVLIFIIWFPMFLFEAVFWVTPIFKLFGNWFHASSSGLSIRYGMARTAGSFTHPILACIMIIAVYRIHRWLMWEGAWREKSKGLLGLFERLSAWLPGTFPQKVMLILILMALMTISRGPWIGGFVGAGLAWVGNRRKRGLTLAAFVVVMAIGGAAAQSALDEYITPEAGEVLSGEALTMLYRKELIDQYKVFLLDRLWTGWGLTTVPKIPGMESVDNAFFLMGLQHGIIAPALFITIIVYATISQLKHGLRVPEGEVPVGFTFAGIYLTCMIAFATVYMGAHTEPLIFFLLGWGESIKRRPDVPLSRVKGSRETPPKGRADAFKRVLL